MKVIVGLGNPGRRYERTRHNLGRMAVRAFRKKFSHIVKKEHDFSVSYRIEDRLVVEPLVYMNLSGISVKEICDCYSVIPQELLIVYDDYALPFGKLRAKARGGAGGHHGMESIIETLQTKEIPRLKLGIGTETTLNELTDYVLEVFDPDEEKQLPTFLDRAADAIECFSQNDIETVMNRFNTQ